MNLESIIGDVVLREAEASSGKDSGPLAPATTLAETGLGSVGFATLIVELEERLGVDPFGGSDGIVYPDTFGELGGPLRGTGDQTVTPLRRDYPINMPQMAMGGLSEFWLFKELGDLHWTLITDGLGGEIQSAGRCERGSALSDLRASASAPRCRSPVSPRTTC